MGPLSSPKACCLPVVPSCLVAVSEASESSGNARLEEEAAVSEVEDCRDKASQDPAPRQRALMRTLAWTESCMG